MTTSNYWRDLKSDNRNMLLTGYGQIGRLLYVFPQGGGPRGTYATLDQLRGYIRTNDTIVIGGVLREQFLAPEFVHGVRIIGAADRPYQATDGGVPIVTTGGVSAGATWLAPSTPVATKPLIELTKNNAGWSFENVMFGPPEDDAAIKITNWDGSGGIGSGHHIFKNLYFSGGFIGIEDNGGMGFSLVERCRFRGHAGAGGGGIVCTSTANAVPLQNTFVECEFFDNVNNFIASQQNSKIKGCTFDRATTAIISTVFNSGQGGGNHVIGNSFNVVAAEFDPTGSTGTVTGATDDIWSGNYLMDAVESVSPPA